MTRFSRMSTVTLFAMGALTGCAGGSGGSGTAEPAPPESAGPRVVQPGAPGSETRRFDGGELEDVRGVSYTEADVSFMQGMIHHHAQALEMTALIPSRTDTEAIRRMGLRMEISQADEIGLMERWLRDRGQTVPEWGGAGAMGHSAMGHEGMDHGAEETMMPGMLTPQQMERLAAAEGREFDRLFLELMIQHHEGAIVMVRDLFSSPGSGQESTVFQFANEVDADQTIEIRRMRELLEAWR